MSNQVPERPDRPTARIITGCLDDTALIAGAYGWTTQQVADMGPVARQLALDFLTSRTATPRRGLRARLATLIHRTA